MSTRNVEAKPLLRDTFPAKTTVDPESEGLPPQFIVRYVPFYSDPSPIGTGQARFNEKFIFGTEDDARQAAIDLAVTCVARPHDILIYKCEDLYIRVVVEEPMAKKGG